VTVAALAILGSIWELLEAATEGIGEAAAIRVAYLLAIGHPDQARILSNKVMYFSGIQALLVSSALLFGGKCLTVLFSSDPTIQYMMNSAMALIAMGNATMCFAQISWSLIGAQGRFRLATLIIFTTRWIVTMPIALICIFVSHLDLNSIGGSLVVGYATASCALGYFVLHSDWSRLSKLMQEINAPCDGVIDLDYLDDLDDDDDDSIY
jgi:Na+-driven multidrug efflux pump